MMTYLHIKIPSLTENIRIVESFIDNAREQFALDEDIYGNIMIAVTESVNNAIIHGNNNDKSKNVDLTLEVEDSRLRFIVKDEGNGFDYDNLPDPTAPENIIMPGGRGIFLIKNLVDEVTFANGGSQVELVFLLHTVKK